MQKEIILLDLFNWREGLGDTLHLRITPKAAKNRIKVEYQEDGSRLIRVYVTAIPENGKANQAVIKILAKELGVSKSSLIITHGHTSRDKIIQIEKRGG